MSGKVNSNSINEHSLAIEMPPTMIQFKLVSTFNDNPCSMPDKILLEYLSISFVQSKWQRIIDYENDLRKLISGISINGAYAY